MSKPVVVKSFLNPNDAYFVKTLLEDSEIPVYLYDENMAGATVSYGVATGGVKVVVPEQYLSDALNIIETEYTEIDTIDSEPNDDFECPKCDSKQIHHSLRYVSGWQYLMLIFVGWLFLKKKKFKCTCRNCRHVWYSY